MRYRFRLGALRSALPAFLAACACATAAEDRTVTLLATAMTARAEWRYVTADPGEGWEKAGFADTAWSVGMSGFGTRETPGGAAGTTWNDSAIWLRRTVTLPDPAALKGIGLLIHHDESAEVYVNGTLVWKDTGFTVDYVGRALDQEAQKAFKAGENLIAVHCAQTRGGQFIDVGLETVVSATSFPILKDARVEAQAWKYTTEDPVTSNWLSAGYNDSLWATDTAAFGAAGTPGLTWNTDWNTPDIWLRKAFTLDSTAYDRFFLSIQHDEDVMVAINGKLVLQRVGYVTRYVDIDVTEPAKAALRPGRNVIAVWCHQTRGGQFIDLGLSGWVEEKPVALMRARAGGRGAAMGPGFPAWSLPGALRRYQADGRALPAR